MSGRHLEPHISSRTPKDLRTAWLLLLLRAEPSYGYVLRRALHERGIDVEAGSVYRSLRELERDAFISSRWAEPGPGPRARVYTITPAGERCLGLLAATIELARAAQDGFLAAYREPRAAPAPD